MHSGLAPVQLANEPRQKPFALDARKAIETAGLQPAGLQTQGRIETVDSAKDKWRLGLNLETPVVSGFNMTVACTVRLHRYS